MSEWILAGGVVSIGFLAFAAYWIYKRGEKVAEGREATKKVGELEFQDKKKNDFIADIERISDEETKLKEEARAKFAAGARVGDIVSLLDEACKRSKTP